MSFRRLQFIAERASIGDEKELLFHIKVQERSGALKDFCFKVLKDFKLSEFNYRYCDKDKADIFLGVQAFSSEERLKLGKCLQDHNYPFKDLSDSDLAKDHIRHMIGGRAKQVPDELIFRLHFADRPNSLLDLLEVISSKWNISLFHFRSHGADFNRALLGIQVPHSNKDDLLELIKAKVLLAVEETENPAYQSFLRVND